MNLYETLMSIFSEEEIRNANLIFSYDSFLDNDCYEHCSSYEEIYDRYSRSRKKISSFNDVIKGLNNIYVYGIDEFCELKNRISTYHYIFDSYMKKYMFQLTISDDEKLIDSQYSLIKYRKNLEEILDNYVEEYKQIEAKIKELEKKNKEKNKIENAQNLKSDYQLIIYQISSALAKSKSIENKEGY
jgi:DNA repair exonuclease SbcCD ATPase subunit